MSVHEHRTAIDWAQEIKYLSDVMFPDAEKIILVMDNRNTHKAASLYKAFPPEEARRIIKRLEIHCTPRHGSWFDMAEIELNVMTRQCLSRRIDTIARLKNELSAWETERSFPNLTTARLNLSSFDVEINGLKKQNFNGQGYTSFLNSIIAISFRQYLSEYAVYDPGLLVIDTPLLGLDQGVSDVSPESMRASLYTYFTNHQDCGQVILLDNM